jgi:hypothetical protein
VGVAVDPEGRLRVGCSGLGVGQLGQPDLTPLVALADGLDLAESGMLLGEIVQSSCELLVAQVGFEVRLQAPLPDVNPAYYDLFGLE